MAERDLYEILGVPKNTSLSDIKRAHHRLARQYHPDREGGNDEKFKEVQTAYEILSDSEKREMYDRYGMDGVRESGGGGMGPMSDMFPSGLFSQFFGGDSFGGFGGGRRRRPRAETIGIPLDVTLEDVYSGATKHVEYKRKVLCKTCSGTGGKHGTVVRCRNCKGSGIQVSHRPIGPGMVQQIQSMCGDCGGTGDFIREKDRCKKCKGKRVIEIDEKLEVIVSPGMSHNQKIPFRGKADEIPDGDAGDLIVILQEQDHALFKRVGIDLMMEKTITLNEALCGCEFVVKHLDGQQLLVKTNPGEAIAPDTMKGVREWGMPSERHTTNKGNLYIKFTVQFPQSGFLPSDEERKKLEELLPRKRQSEELLEEAEEVDMIDFEGTKGEDGGLGGEDSSDEEDSGRRGGHHNHVGCSQQ
ncbi:DnaJ homolog subfamily A member 2 [Geodia barretti]|uniref:DnaJ homolog subfamily A member 2 n=1 Tax=Geodia barretti TaxID=519541 RepID=A0AA35R1Z0_GEOBA|nr:DnaJ homolog subfamily A member 2 [Geodia barretti]